MILDGWSGNVLLRIIFSFLNGIEIAAALFHWRETALVAYHVIHYCWCNRWPTVALLVTRGHRCAMLSEIANSCRDVIMSPGRFHFATSGVAELWPNMVGRRAIRTKIRGILWLYNPLFDYISNTVTTFCANIKRYMPIRRVQSLCRSFAHLASQPEVRTVSALDAIRLGEVRIPVHRW